MSSRSQEGPLAGVRVADATSGIAGPVAYTLTMDLGGRHVSTVFRR